jgi:hypothetical protein
VAKELKSAEELKALLDQELTAGAGPLDGAQFIKIVPAEPSTGANWTVSHSGESGGLRAPSTKSSTD